MEKMFNFISVIGGLVGGLSSKQRKRRKCHYRNQKRRICNKPYIH